MTEELLGRAVSPDSTRQLWAVISALEEKGEAATSGALSAGLSETMDEGAVTAKLAAAVDAGLVVRAADQDGTPLDLYGHAEPPEHFEEPEHDWYCFECHTSSAGDQLLSCTACYRVYHPQCSPTPVADPISFICDICESCAKQADLDQHAMLNKLDAILVWIHKEGGAGLTLPMNDAALTEDQYNRLVARHTDLEVLKARLNGREYTNARQFLADLQLLVHNVVVVYGKASNLGRRALRILVEVRKRITQLETVMDEGQLDVTGDADDQLVKPLRVRPGGSLDGSPSVKRARRSGGAVAAAAVVTEGYEDGDPDVVVHTEQVLCNVGRAKPNSGGFSQTGWAMDENLKQMIMELQRYWLSEYQQSREKLLVDMTEKLHQEFLSDQQKIRTELLTQFKDELDATRQELDQKYRDTLKQEVQKLNEKHRRELSNTKKKQWCWQCESEAIYHCCWNTAYCSVECQQSHWATHRKYCRRKKGEPTTGAIANR